MENDAGKLEFKEEKFLVNGDHISEEEKNSLRLSMMPGGEKGDHSVPEGLGFIPNVLLAQETKGSGAYRSEEGGAFSSRQS